MEKSFSSLCGLCKTAHILVIVGAINWGLIGIGAFLGTDWNVAYMLLGNWPFVEWAAYVLIGVAGVFKIFSYKCPCKWDKKA
ncbi:MAG: DUF378 domain-containing protein [Candidatus Peregrinibacteria bacterium]|nr:DUF378 domain-containing protein [Candidatus Peregrinibacteria bacterium]